LGDCKERGKVFAKGALDGVEKRMVSGENGMHAFPAGGELAAKCIDAFSPGKQGVS
jgi:hypothetical protein